ncbi:MAG: hypothetical protein JNL08_16625 [Planctomycetes bacterium]|nr:hypothetical protein [Planctomycetota bacterium]
MTDDRAAKPASLAVPTALAALTLGTVIAFDAPTMQASIAVWCAVWVGTLAPQRVATWSPAARRMALAVGFAWTALFIAMTLTVRITDVGGNAHAVTTGWPFEAFVGVFDGSRSAASSNFRWLWSPLLTHGPPRIYTSNECATNLWLWGSIGALAATCLPARWLPLALATARIAAPAAAAMAHCVVPFWTQEFVQ